MDQTAKRDVGKPRPTLVPVKAIWAIAAIREYGAAKYGGRDGWKRVEPERYRDALYRHLLAYLEEPFGLDAESHLPHLWHLLTNAAFLTALEWKKHIRSMAERSKVWVIRFRSVKPAKRR